MESSEINTPSIDNGKEKFPWQGLLLLLGIFAIVGGLIYYQSYSTKHGLEKFAREQLLAKNYTILELNLVDYNTSSKAKAEGGKVTFIVKDNHSLILEGKADIVTERHWLVLSKKAFKLTSLKPKK